MFWGIYKSIWTEILKPLWFSGSVVSQRRPWFLLRNNDVDCRLGWCCRGPRRAPSQQRAAWKYIQFRARSAGARLKVVEPLREEWREGVWGGGYDNKARSIRAVCRGTFAQDQLPLVKRTPAHALPDIRPPPWHGFEAPLTGRGHDLSHCLAELL